MVVLLHVGSCSRCHCGQHLNAIEKEVGPDHEKSFICSVQFEIADVVHFEAGDEKPRVKDAENSAASMMLRGLLIRKIEREVGPAPNGLFAMQTSE
ncbi:hypothetical protein RJ640_004736 [Escallonia rubra]|uniref:DRBM domain-containing protein n=1 Tax=Escallonia rubra TaxID=112253 RepID=A0AA88QSW6_9ASTE|nr:hypothetical protein RJ640_004736 [Escallonia rubra]